MELERQVVAVTAAETHSPRAYGHKKAFIVEAMCFIKGK
jgi:hypothetical protein